MLNTPKGSLELTFITPYGNTQSFLTNAVLPNARKLQARALGGDQAYIVDTIEVYLGATLLAADTVVASFPGIESVKFTAVFSESSFSGSFDRLVLKNALNGNFSEVTGISLSKPSGQKLAIGWELKPQ